MTGMRDVHSFDRLFLIMSRADWPRGTSLAAFGFNQSKGFCDARLSRTVSRLRRRPQTGLTGRDKTGISYPARAQPSEVVSSAKRTSRPSLSRARLLGRGDVLSQHPLLTDREALRGRFRVSITCDEL